MDGGSGSDALRRQDEAWRRDNLAGVELMRVAHGAGNNDEGQKAGGQDAERSHRQAPPGAEAEVRESRWRGLQPYSLGGETRRGSMRGSVTVCFEPFIAQSPLFRAEERALCGREKCVSEWTTPLFPARRRFQRW